MKVHLAKTWKAFRDSFKLGMPFLFSLASEILFFLALSGIAILSAKWLVSIGSSFTGFNPYDISDKTAAFASSFITQSLLAIGITLLLVFIVYTICQALSWNAIFSRKLSFRFIRRFFLLNVAWLIPWVIVAWFFVVGLQGKFAAFGLVFLAIMFTHLTFLLQHAFLMDHGIKQSMGIAFSVGIGSIHKFIVPYIFAAAVYFLWSLVWYAVPKSNNLGFSLVVLSCVIFAPYLAWFKFYLHKLLV
jgi:hypothetical protein